MKELRITLCALAIALATVLMVGPIRAQDPASRAEAAAATGMGLADSALVSTAFTYQGRLRDGAGPVNGVCDFTFWLYDAPSGGSPLGAVPIPGVDVSDGYFTVVLDFGAGAFDGQDRWLEIEVDCGGAAATLSSSAQGSGLQVRIILSGEPPSRVSVTGFATSEPLCPRKCSERAWQTAATRPFRPNTNPHQPASTPRIYQAPLAEAPSLYAGV